MIRFGFAISIYAQQTLKLRATQQLRQLAQAGQRDNENRQPTGCIHAEKSA
jgi:hypothetical protein